MRKIIFPILFVLFTATASLCAKPIVVFDQGHAQRFVIEKEGELHLSALAQTFRDSGYEVRSTTMSVTAPLLKGVTAYVSAGGFAPFSLEEVAALKEFTDNGGAVSVMMHIGPTYARLLVGLGVAPSVGVIRETESVIGINSLNFHIVNLANHKLFEGIDSFNLYGGWAMINADETTELIAMTSEKAWMDLNRDKKRNPETEPFQSLAVVAASKREKGKLVVFGDDAIFQNRFITGNNLKLAQNLAKWLKEK